MTHSKETSQSHLRLEFFREEENKTKNKTKRLLHFENLLGETPSPKHNVDSSGLLLALFPGTATNRSVTNNDGRTTDIWL